MTLTVLLYIVSGIQFWINDYIENLKKYAIMILPFGGYFVLILHFLIKGA